MDTYTYAQEVVRSKAKESPCYLCEYDDCDGCEYEEYGWITGKL